MQCVDCAGKPNVTSGLSKPFADETGVIPGPNGSNTRVRITFRCVEEAAGRHSGTAGDKAAPAGK
jgi:hypothetical protein